jgi:thiamine-monophosphate kinase
MSGLGEFDLIRRYFKRSAGPRRALLGIGDDCALLSAPSEGALAVSTDMLVEGHHFFADVDAAALGHKALAVNLSDLAAMGAKPIGFTLALALPDADERWLAGFSAGLFALADAHDCELMGGDTTRGPRTISITVLGEVPPALALRRDGARPGDEIWVSGCLGAAAWAVEDRVDDRAAASKSATNSATNEASESTSDTTSMTAAASNAAAKTTTCSAAWVDASLRAQAWQRLERPEPRVALGQALRGVATAAIDLSDGLIGDLGHVLTRSSEALALQSARSDRDAPAVLGATLAWSAMPCHAVLQTVAFERRIRLALAGGDDYELLFCAPPSCRATIDALGAHLGLTLTRVGQIDARPGVRLLDADQQPLTIHVRSFDHFR